MSIQGSMTDPARNAAAVTASDATVFDPPTRGLYVAGHGDVEPTSGGIKHGGLYVAVAGDVAVRMVEGTSATFTALAAGIVHPLAVDKVLATGTTATGIVRVW